MKIKSDAVYDIVAPTSMGLRFTPVNREPIHTSQLFKVQATSAESNVLSCGSALGLNNKLLTVFIKNHPISQFIKNDLSKRHIKYESQDKDPQGPWGYRHQINIADSGFGSRGPFVQNDRSGEVGKTLSYADFDLKKLLIEQGVKIIHISGLIASLSKSTATLCIYLAKAAKKEESLISFDLNYRASFWKNREKELKDVFNEIAGLSDILIGNEEDFQLALGIDGPKIGGKDINLKMNSYQSMLEMVKETYSNVSIVGSTLREVVNANEHLWGCIVNYKDDWEIIEPKPIVVKDRIGGGDGFVGGLLYGILTKKSFKESVQFGWANGAYTATILNDYSTPLSESQIWNIWIEKSRIIR